MFPGNSTNQHGQRAHHQYGRLAHHYHHASSAEQANRGFDTQAKRNTPRPDDIARKKEPQSHQRGTRAGRRHRQKPQQQRDPQHHPRHDTRNTSHDNRLIHQPVAHQPVAYQPVAHQPMSQKHHPLDTFAEQIILQLRHNSQERHNQQMTELRLTLEKQRDDIGKSFRQILFSNTRKPSYNTVSNTNNDDMDINTNNDDMNSNTDNDDMGSITDDDVDENDSERETDYMDDSDEVDNTEEHHSSSSNSSIYKQSDSSNTTGVAPSSSPSTCSQIEDIRDPLVKALTKRHSLTQLHEWLSVINSLTSATMVTSQHLDLHQTSHPVSQLIIIKPLLKSFNDGYHHLAWPGYAKYENFKPWKTKQSFYPRHPHCWFCVLAATTANPPPQYQGWFNGAPVKTTP